ncbi:CBU_0592 family membrane protein [Roseovarius litorisediminis]|uniref:CBU_0592 family membrane protein n=1 Tax=Roseovarius litorisediminis TaxID=1312363 RepID=UPI000A26EEDA|nr:hypothetical protein [Roseovarius litorisediminis]
MQKIISTFWGYFYGVVRFSAVDSILVFRAVGLLGFTIYVMGFFCLCTGRLTSSPPAYFLLVFSASTCVLISLLVDFNLSAALIHCFYVVMVLGRAVLRWRQHRSNRPRSPGGLFITTQSLVQPSRHVS